MSAEHNFRQAFERLKTGKPMRLPLGANVSQNNVAREAGTDPSALKKSRFPTLIAEIQRHISTFPVQIPPSKRKEQLQRQRTNRSLEEQLADAVAERDKLASMRVEADLTILVLREKLAEYEQKDMRSQQYGSPQKKKITANRR